jgi:hypothetical protein
MEKQVLSGVHWLGPATMLLALTTGVLLAVAHHLFYRSLHEHEVPSGDYEVALFAASRQQTNTAIGTALAFAVRSALALAVSSAFVQLFWIRLGATSLRPLTLEHINTAFSVPHNVFTLFNVKSWWRFPLLFTLALTVW